MKNTSGDSSMSTDTAIKFNELSTMPCLKKPPVKARNHAPRLKRFGFLVVVLAVTGCGSIAPRPATQDEVRNRVKEDTSRM